MTQREFPHARKTSENLPKQHRQSRKEGEFRRIAVQAEGKTAIAWTARWVGREMERPGMDSAVSLAGGIIEEVHQGERESRRLLPVREMGGIQLQVA